MKKACVFVIIVAWMSTNVSWASYEWYTNPANGHQYALTLSHSNWTDAEAEAVAVGGHLVTVNDEAERDWLIDVNSNPFGNSYTQNYPGYPAHNGVWVGLEYVEGDIHSQESWQWVNGEPITFWEVLPAFYTLTGIHMTMTGTYHNGAGQFVNAPHHDYEPPLYLKGVIEVISEPLAVAMVYIPGGEFQMGDHHDGIPDACDVHAVYLDSFFMSKFEIPNRQYCDYLNFAKDAGDIKVDGGIVYDFHDSSNSYPYCNTHSYDAQSQIDYNDVSGTFSVRTKGGRDMSDDPVVEVSWYGAVAYCNWRSSEEGYESCYNLSTWDCDFSKNGYRLPTEAEWEYAARGGNHNPYYRFPWGDTINHDHVNYRANSSEFPYDTSPYTTSTYHPMWNDGIYPYTSPVGSFTANGYGLYDMAGNSLEWCNDWYDSDYYDVSPYDNPTGPASGIGRVIRLGSYVSHANHCRVAFRAYNHPDGRDGHFGFRVVRIPESTVLLNDPNGGESLTSGKAYPVKWSSAGYISDVLIEYSVDNGSSWMPVSPPNVGNNGLYNWLVPKVRSNQCLMRVSNVSDPNISDTSDDVFTIGLAAIGHIEAWGRDATAPIGNYFIAIAGGAYHSLALWADGSLAAWGKNDYGQCNVPTGFDFVVIDGGFSHSLALRSNGSLVAWGGNNSGQCDVPTGFDFVAIDAGITHNLALKSDGSIVAWGNNAQGQCNIPVGNDFVAIAAGQVHSIALKTDGSLVGWGRDTNNDYGEADVPAGNDYIDIASKGYHTLALKSDNSIVGWGDNLDGQCDIAGNDFTAIATGETFSVALKFDGSLVAVGQNPTGECDVPVGNDYIDIAAGSFHGLALVYEHAIGWYIDWIALSLFVDRWLDEGCSDTNDWCGYADINRDTKVDFSDYSWLTKYFSSIAPEPNTASNPEPNDTATDVGITADLSWTAGSDAAAHGVYFGTNPTSDANEFQGYQTDTIFNPGTMAADTTYYWQVDEVGLGGETTGVIWSFSTSPVPGKAYNPNPSDLASNININQNLSWTANFYTTSHDVYFGTNPTPGAGEFEGNQTSTTFDPGTLDYETTYYWRIDGVGPGGTTTGVIWSFTTEATPVPGQATNPVPANMATDVNITTCMSWIAGVNTTSHDVYFGTSSPGDFQGNQQDTTFCPPSNLDYGTTYYWRVDEKNPYNTTTGVIWSFTTEASPVPGQAGNPSPANMAIDVNITICLNWTAGVNTESHDVYFGTNPIPDINDLQGNQTTTTFYPPSSLEYGTTYYWRIDEKNPYNTTTGEVWSFTTMVDPNLVGWWKFDEASGVIAYDSSGKEKHGQLVDGIGNGLVWSPGESALNFDGSNNLSRVVASTVGMSTTAGTINIWANLAEPQNRGDGRNGSGYFFGCDNGVKDRILLYMDNSNTQLDVRVGDHSETNIITLGTLAWYHIALTWDRGSYVVHLNGSEIAAGTYGGLTTLPSTADIGNNGGSYKQSFHGLMGDVQVYDKSLSTVAIQRLYQDVAD